MEKRKVKDSIVWFFERLMFLVDTEPEVRDGDGRLRISLDKIGDPETIEKREIAIVELMGALNDPEHRKLLSNQFIARSNALMLAIFKIKEIKQLVDDGEIDAEKKIELIDEIFKIEVAGMRLTLFERLVQRLKRSVGKKK